VEYLKITKNDIEWKVIETMLNHQSLLVTKTYYDHQQFQSSHNNQQSNYGDIK
jgi:hypothetical protein